jgi:hypothetical protein
MKNTGTFNIVNPVYYIDFKANIVNFALLINPYDGARVNE